VWHFTKQLELIDAIGQADSFDSLLKQKLPKDTQHIFQIELGTHLHLQGALRGKNQVRARRARCLSTRGGNTHPHLVLRALPQIRFSTLKAIDAGVHWEAARGSWQQAIEYCSKTDTRWEPAGDRAWTKGCYVPETLITIKEADLYPWQKDVLKIVRGPVDPRHIIHLWEPDGNAGKSALVKFLFVQEPRVCVVAGKGADVANNIANFYEEHGVFPKTVIFDVPRSSAGYVSYATMENVKNGLLNNTKYHALTLAFNPPHVLVFSNEPPKDETMSKDRWIVGQIASKKVQFAPLFSVTPPHAASCLCSACINADEDFAIDFGAPAWPAATNFSAHSVPLPSAPPMDGMPERYAALLARMDSPVPAAAAFRGDAYADVEPPPRRVPLLPRPPACACSFGYQCSYCKSLVGKK
jgi:hypothetical protein